ncbi:queuosine biosynthesis protein QueC [Sulfurimonas hongkongensis]|uniref:7-cyano-7-deazaguanine synthase n=1 Tax=Sulfurimonas hongkongensis TaxID=1172190 RepID=T0L376_9BACT|nr:7-cyano-7-deazaguanine synthase QueC [Sulfurimonas hongkongensis]EQB40278.1 queuosine biosynthesis protein QueC [Sulfurimonas hongkongensis]
MKTKEKKALCIMSGGMDSTLSAYMMRDEGYEIIALHFNYSQLTQNKELECFDAICKDLGVKERYNLDLDFFSKIGASALIDKGIEVQTSGIEDGIPSTYVPFRNGIFLSIATAIAEKEGASTISIGVVEEDGSGYPDCTDTFIKSMQNSINLGTKDETALEIKMPLVHLSKSQIVQASLELKVPLELTWSCYKNETKACGVCDSCRLRLRGFKLAGISDPIAYE